ncbi:MAG: vitamin K epoxide reductase family protein [Actinomycetota bacterium]
MAGSKQARPANRRQAQGSRNGRGPQAQGKQAGSQQASPARPAPAARDTAVEPAAADPRWLQYSALLLSVAGLGVSIYLTIAHYTSSAILACSESGLVNCSKVTTSPESNVFGIFPVAVLGLAFFVFMVAVNSPWAWRSRQPLIPMARLASVLIGIVFVLYLIYTELFTLNAICLYCTAVHVITFLLFGLVMFSTATRTAPARTAAPARSRR